jgi:hypothetical protein
MVLYLVAAGTLHLKHQAKAGHRSPAKPRCPSATEKHRAAGERQTEIAMRHYIALIHKDAVTAGVDLDDARRMAEEALALHLVGRKAASTL